MRTLFISNLPWEGNKGIRTPNKPSGLTEIREIRGVRFAKYEDEVVLSTVELESVMETVAAAHEIRTPMYSQSTPRASGPWLSLADQDLT